MYIFNKVTVKPKLPDRISRLMEIANNLWWSWNTEFLRLLMIIDKEVWEKSEKNPVKFLKQVAQEKLEEISKDEVFLKDYDRIVKNFDEYMGSKKTWFNENYPNNKGDLIAYFSAEYGLDQILPIYSGGLGILSGDHLKSSSDLGIPLVAVGLLYKNGYFHQKINAKGGQEAVYHNIDLANLPINPVITESGEELITYVRFLKRKVYLKIWRINVGRVKLYLLDSDIDLNNEEDRQITLRLYGGDREMRIRQEIVLGMAGVNLFKYLKLEPTVYHMNEGHSSFLTVELARDIVETKQVSFKIAKDIISSKTLFTTHTPVPAGNDIFDINLVEKYFKDFWPRLGLTREEFLRLGMKDSDFLEPGFNMGILALRISGKKNGVSKLHGEVSRELFSEVWSNIAPEESPIDYITNGIHTCSWLAPNIKGLYNQYLQPYWQDNIYDDSVWEKINSIPDDQLWDAHMDRKIKLLNLVKENVSNRLRNTDVNAIEINEIVSKLNPKALTIGFARRFATYKRATLLFKDLEKITKILNDEERPVQLIFAGKAHPADKEGQDLIKYIHELSMKPQFKGKIFLLENYSIAMSRYLISGVDVWLNTPRRPMEASGTSGQKASANGVLNFSVLDGWWAEGYDGTNGWTIGNHDEYDSYEIQDIADSQSIYDTLETDIIPTYYDMNENGISLAWIGMMKSSIITTAGKYSTARMIKDYTTKFYMPLSNLYTKYYKDLETVAQFNTWKSNMYLNWHNISINKLEGEDNIELNAGSIVEAKCEVTLPNIDMNNVSVEVYCGKITETGILEKAEIIPMNLIAKDEENKKYTYSAKIEFKSSGEFGYAFRVMPKHEMLLDRENLNLIKWIER